MDSQVGKEIKSIMDQLASDAPGATEGLGALIGAAAGAFIGGGMVAGIGVLAAPIALLGIGGYALASRWKKAKILAALNTAIEKLYAIQNRLLSNAEHYKEELATLSALVEALLARQKKIRRG